MFLTIPEDKPERVDEHATFIDLRAVRAATGLFALIIFSTFNNLIGGVYIAR